MLHSRGPGPVEVWELLSGNLWPTGRWEKWGLSLPQATVGLSRTPWGLLLAWTMSNTQPYGSREGPGRDEGGGGGWVDEKW